MRSYYLLQLLERLKVGFMRKSSLRMEVRIDSPDPENIAGEILCKGENLMLGYYKNDEITAQVVTATDGCTPEILQSWTKKEMYS